MNTPNKLTLARIILVIPFIILIIFTIYFKNINDNNYSYTMIATGSLFSLAMVTDFIDGFLARKNNQISSFGKLFDPLADKFITTTALIGLSVLGIVPFYISLIFILRDILVDGSRNLAAKNNVIIAASLTGKTKTMIMSLGLVLIFFTAPYISGSVNLINPSWEFWLLILPIIFSALLSTISGYIYFKAIIPYINIK